MRCVSKQFNRIKSEMKREILENDSARKIQNFFLKKMYEIASKSSKSRKLPPYGQYDGYVRSHQEKRNILKLRKYVMRLVTVKTIHDSIRLVATQR